MSKLLTNFLPNIFLISFLVGLLCFPYPLSVFAMGMDWGGGGDSGGETACTPDDPLVIIPGPIGSPLRITPFDNQIYLVADYSRKQLFWYSNTATLTPFIETLGRPLSVAVSKASNPSGKIKEFYYFVGNDDSRSIDIYYEKNDQFLLVGQYPVGTDGIQALDMAFDQELNQLFVVDGLAREIKVVQPDGQLVRSFGAGVLDDPKGIAIDATAGEIYVSDVGNPLGYPVVPATIKVFDMLGGHLSDRMINGDGLFSRPQGLAIAADKVYLVDSVSSQILEFDRVTRTKTTSFGCKGSSDEHLMLPMDVTLAEAGQKLYVADNRNMRITVLPLTSPGDTP